MLIDWFTVGAQALNFLILVWLMKRFLYKPILHAIDEREKRVATELANADAKKAEAQREHDEFQHKNTEFDQQRAALFSKATDEAKAERQRLLDEARKAADALSSKRQETLRNEEQSLHQAIRWRAQQEVFAIVRKALTDLATTSLEERLGEVFTRRLREMDGKAKEALGEALKTASGPGVVRSTFDLPADQRAAIQNALNETSSAEVRVRFETAPDLIGGIEFTTNGQKVAWSIADYLASMEKSVGELLQEKAKTEAKAEPKPEVKTEPEAKTESEAKAEPEPGTTAKPEATAGVKTEVKTEPKPEAETEPEATAKTKAKTEPKAEATAEPEPEATAKTEAKTEPKAEATAAPEPEATAEAKSEEPEPAATKSQ